MKSCSRCKQELPESNFYEREGGRLFSHCKKCVSKKQAAHYAENKDSKAQYGKSYYQANREKVLARCRAYRAKSKPAKRIRKANMKWLSAWKRLKRGQDVQFAIREKLRKQIWARLKRAGASKRATTIQLLGCSVQEFRKHMESLWKSGMAWNNHGKVWHIDHIRPLSSFDLTRLDQQLEAFHFSNTQPLFAFENLTKKDKWNFQDSTHTTK